MKMKLKKRKWLSLLLCFALILSLMPTAALAAGNVFSGGNGTEASPYEISDLATLEAFREYVNAGSGAGEYFKLTADIDMSEKYGADIGGSEISWTPIGNGIVPFTGNFDGGGHKISGLYINSTSDYQGLFGYVGEGGTVQDLGVDGTVSGSCVGGVVGINNGGTVTSCYNTGDVSGGEAVGGVVGYNGGTVTNCYNTGDVSGSGYVGGVVGYSDGTVTNCYYLTGTADGGINGADAEGGAEAKTAAEFATQSTFVGWDFDGTWSMDNILGRPVLAAIAETDYFSGEGTAESPYLIPDLATLEIFRNYINAYNGAGEYFKLTADIDMSEKYGADIGGSEVSWTPIGNDNNPFKGNFDGSGHKISGLYINSTSDYQGLFGYVGEGGTVQNLGVDGTVSGGEAVGGVVGINNGTVTNCCNTGDVSGSGYVGGVVGVTNGTMTNCRNTGDVSGGSEGSLVGGVVGATNGTVTNCCNTGDVSGSDYVGGVAGYSNNGGTVTNCCNTGDVSGTNIAVGGVGGDSGYSASTITNCYNTGTVSGSGYVGGVVGWNNGTVTNCYYLTGTADGGINGADAEGGAEVKTAAEFAVQNTFVNWDFGGTWSMDNIFGRPVLTAIAETDYFSGEGTAESPYLIPDLATLEIFRNYINAYNGAGEYFKLTADIDMSENYGADIGGSEVSWTPIGNGIVPFTGNFDGGGHTISGLYINAPSSDKQGLFGVVGEGGTVQNLGVDGWVIGDYYVGGVVGMNYGTVTSCFNTGDVGGDYYVGGVAGMSNGTVTSCFNTGDVNGSDYVGGVAGRSYSTVTNCYYLTGTANGGIGGTEDSGGESTDKEGSAEAKTAEEFATQSTFVGWDFDTIWQMSDTLKRPTLRSNPENAS